jgi:hypothetical protein
MSNPVQDQDEDIIILWDITDVNQPQTNDAWEKDLEKREVFPTDFVSNTPNENSSPTNNKIEEDSPFDFGFDTGVEEKSIIQEQKREENSFSWFDLPSQNQNNENSQEEILKNTEQQIPQSVSSFLDEKREESDIISFPQGWSSSSTGDDDMNSILETTIKKLKKRQLDIAEDKTNKIEQIDIRNEKIRTLKEEVADLKDWVEVLNVENQKIEANITNLEKMKLGSEPIVEVEVKKKVQKIKVV